MKTFKHEYRYSDYIHTQYTNVYQELHREDGPAYIVEFDTGRYTEEWYYLDLEHRYGGPAQISIPGKNHYFIEGELVDDKVYPWLEERGYVWEKMADIEKWELDVFMRTL